MQQKFYEYYGMLRAIGIIAAIFFLGYGKTLWCRDHGMTLDIELNVETAIENSSIKDEILEKETFEIEKEDGTRETVEGWRV